MKPKYSTINARAKTVVEKPTYRDVFKHKVCLIPATEFYEWKREDVKTPPHHIQMKDGKLFAFAGLRDHWYKDGEGFDGCFIIVTAANKTMQPIHNRISVILNQAQYGSCLKIGGYNRAKLESTLFPYVGELEVYLTSRKINIPRNDNPSLMKSIF